MFETVSIVIPIYNEDRTLEKIIRAVECAPIFDLKKEIILADDFSTDKSRKILEQYEGKYKIFYHKENQGKGEALKTGFKNATGDIVLVQDADLEYDPNEYEALLKPILDNKADVVYGSRFLGGRPHRVLYFWHYVGKRFLTVFSNMLTDLNLSDMETCYKVFRKEILDKFLPKLESKGFGFEPEVTARISKLSKRGKCRIYEVGISYYGRTYEEGKKIGWKDGFKAIWAILKYNILG